MQLNRLKLLLKGSLFGLLVFVATTSATAQPTVERAKRGVPAELIDQGDYYQHPDGSRISFYRKKDVFAIRKAPTGVRTKSVDLATRFKSQFGNRVDFVKGHGLGATTVVRIDNSLKRKGAYTITPQMLKSMDSSISEMEPVLANARGSGDILVTSKLLIKLKDGQNDQALNEVLSRFNLTLNRRLVAPGFIYSVTSNQPGDVTSRFSLVRGVMNDARIEWAQPQFKSRAFKTTFEPNDPLFNEQWNLRNTGKGGSRCDTDCDANNAWDIGNANGVGAVSGNNTIIAVIDDGVQLNHADLAIWQNPGEIGGGKDTNGFDDDGNGYIDDWRGWDFVDDRLSSLLNPLADISECKNLLVSDTDPSDSNNVKCLCQDKDGTDKDGTLGPDNNPGPQPNSACLTFDDEVVVEQDNHGTAVAGIAAARGNNGEGVAGAAYSARILPIRLISEFDGDPDDDFCARVVEAMTYAGLYADVINNSWEMEEGTCAALDTVIAKVVDGTLDDIGSNVPRRDGKGSPVVFASGNSASGWVKVTVPVTAGRHSYEWRFLRSAFSGDFDDFAEDDSAWLDDIRFPDGSVEGFESGLKDFLNECAVDSCNGDCAGEVLSSCPKWQINSDPNFSRSGNSVKIDQLNSFCANSYLHTIKDGPAGEISFWVWVSTDQQIASDKFEFLVDGKEQTSFGDLANVVDNAVAYPANVLKSIAVGASDSGDLSGSSVASLAAEERTSYSQYGATLDVLAPSSSQHLGIVTTDRYGVSGEGYNSNRNVGGSSAADPRYTDDFGGTSAAAPLVAGVAAAMIAADGNITAASVETTLRATADKIGRRGAAAYNQIGNTRSEFYGYGRVNMFKALKSVLGVSDADASICTPEGFTYTRTTDLLLPSFAPQATEFCPAKGPVESGVDDENCFVITTLSGNHAVICF